MKSHNRQPGTRFARRATRRGGYTLLEVLVSMGIFAIGFVAVAALFPVAALMQRQTMDDVLGQQFRRNAEALLLVRPFDNADMDAAQPVGLPRPSGGANKVEDFYVYPLSATLPAVNPLNGRWSLEDRSYPATTPRPGTASGIPVGANRRYYWVPLARRTAYLDASTPHTQANEWQVFVFLLCR